MSKLDHARRARIPAAELPDLSGRLTPVRLSGDGPPLFVDHVFDSLRFRLGTDGAVPEFEVVSGLDWPQVHSRYVLLQPEVVCRDPRAGWVPLGGIYPESVLIGPRETPEFAFPQTIEQGPQLLLCAYDTYLSITACPGTVASARIAPSCRLAPETLPEPG